MADLGPAWIGLGGVALGSLVPLATEWRRERRTRRERVLEQQRSALLEVLHESSAVVGATAGILDLLAASPRGRVNLDLTTLDERIVSMSQAIDTIRVIGPAELVEPLADMLEVALDLGRGPLQSMDAESHESLSRRMYELKLVVIEVGRKHDLAV